MKLKQYFLIPIITLSCSTILLAKPAVDQSKIIENLELNGLRINKAIGKPDNYYIVIDTRSTGFPKNPKESILLACKEMQIIGIVINADGELVTGLIESIANSCNKINNLKLLIYGNSGKLSLDYLSKMQLQNFSFGDLSADRSEKNNSIKVMQALHGMKLGSLAVHDLIVTANFLDFIEKSQETLYSISFSRFDDIDAVLTQLVEFPNIEEIDISEENYSEYIHTKLILFEKQYEEKYSRDLVLMVNGASP